MEESVSVDPVLHDDNACDDSDCALVELHPATPERFVRNEQVLTVTDIYFIYCSCCIALHLNILFYCSCIIFVLL